MSQLRKCYGEIYPQIEEEHPEWFKWETLDELQKNADNIHRREWEIKAERIYLNKNKHEKLRRRVAEAIDFKIWTEKTEFMDRPDYDEKKKAFMLEQVFYIGKLIGTQRILRKELLKIAEMVLKNGKDKANFLELCSGSGKALVEELGQVAKKKNLPMSFTGSDIVKTYIDQGNSRAMTLGLSDIVKFIYADALSFENIEQGRFDGAIMTQAMHHFTAGELARIFANCVEKTKWGFLGIEGVRNAFLLPLMAGGSTIQVALGGAPKEHIYDATVTILRFWSEPQLEMIARVACPDSVIDMRTREIGLTKLHIYNK